MEQEIGELGCEGWIGVHTAGEMGGNVSQAEGTEHTRQTRQIWG